jgi:hypothetical protein
LRYWKTYTRYHPSSTPVIQQSHTSLVDFSCLDLIILHLGIIEKVAANPVQAMAELRDELLSGLFILVAASRGYGAVMVA